MDPELLRLLLEALRNQNTTGSAATGGDWPYDDYGLQGTIGGLGAVDPASAPVPNTIGAHDFGFVGDPFYMSEGTNGQAAIGGPFVAPDPREKLAALLAQMQQGVGAGPAQPGLSGLFGSTPTVQHPHPTVTPVAAPVAGTAQPPPKGTPTPDPRRDASTLPRKPDKSKQVQLRAPQAVQQITRQAQAAQPQRQYSAPIPQQQRTFSAPAPTFTSAPASRSAPQNSLANTLNLMRSLVRR